MPNAETDNTSSDNAPAAPLSVTWRPGETAVSWILLPGMLAFSLGAMACLTFLSGTSNLGLEITLAACCAFFLLAMVPGIIWARRGAIVAEENGLRWRGLGGWKAARWDEVRDYYNCPFTGAYPSAVVETAAGRIKIISGRPDFQPFKEAVKQCAANAAASDWSLVGTRPCDPWPRVFGYDTFSNRWSPRLLVKLSVAFVVYVLVKPALGLTGLAALLGWRMTLTTAALYLLLTLPLAIMLLVRPLLDYRAVQKRMGERVTLNPDGLVFEDGARRIHARWEEVTGYGIVGGKYTVETSGGAFDFLGSIGSGLLLRVNIRLYATKAADTEWKTRTDADALGGEGACWSSGQIGAGARVFHYRTRTVRAWLWGSFVLLLVFCATMTIIQLSNVSGSGGFVAQTVLYVSMGFFWLLYGRRYFCVAGVHLDEDGLTQISPFGQTRLAWAHIRDFWVIFNSEGRVTGYRVEGRDGRRIHFGVSIVGREELKAEIGRRAAHCGRTEWQKRSPA